MISLEKQHYIVLNLLHAYLHSAPTRASHSSNLRNPRIFMQPSMFSMSKPCVVHATPYIDCAESPHNIQEGRHVKTGK